MKELTLLSGITGVTPAKIAADARALTAMNLLTEGRGLMLTERDAREIAETRHRAIRDNGRVEIGIGAVEKLMLVFSGSPFVQPKDWAVLVNTLVDCFYFIKTDTHDAVNDNELIRMMLDEFEEHCQGDETMFCQRMEALVRRINGEEEADGE